MATAGSTASSQPSGGLPILDFEALVAYAPKTVHDGFSQKNFRRSVSEYAQRRPSSLARVRWTADGKPYRSLAAILREETAPEKVAIVVYEPRQDPQAWEFTTPMALVTTDAPGGGKVVTFRYNPHRVPPWDPHDPGTEEPCVVRFSFRESYVPRSIRQETEANEGRPPAPPAFELFSLEEMFRFVHATGVVPFRIGLHLYTRATRLRYELDLIHNVVLADPRAGRFSLEDRVERSARMCHGIDRFVARGSLPLLPRRVLELLFDSRGLSVPDVSVILGVSPELAKAALESLVGRQLAALDQRSQTFLPLPRVFLTRAEAERELRDEEERKRKGPATAALRDSVQELLRDVESKAGCPLCGREMTPGSSELLCEDCQAAVEAEAEAGGDGARSQDPGGPSDPPPPEG
jgi:hypothetical protein